MADVNANIGVNIDTSLALAQLKSLQRQISQFHTSIARSSETAALAQKSLQKNFLNSVNAIGSFSAELRTVKTTTESFTSSLEGNKFSMREYFRYAGGATKTFGRLFKSEFDTIGKVAEERVKRLQTQYIKMGRDANGAMQAISITPTALDMENYGTKTAIAAQKQALFNQLMRQGSTNLLNFGKNTQWAGRQLMVGFTIPLAMVGSAATKTFMDMEAQALKFRKVYGDLFTPKEETQQALDNITELGKQFTRYGVAVSTTVGLAAEAAAAGFSGLDLQRQTTEATRLSILGQLDSQKALETTISLQNSFGMSSEKLADSINFLNAVENQTVVSLDDITTAIPKVAPVIQQLGGDVKDLTFFMAAMKEGGINASEGANALKSGLAALINPTGRASEMLKSFGINAKEIVTSNKGDLKATVIEFATALNQLDPLNRAQAIEQMFGKFQFARLSTLFANVAKDGNQAARVLDLANSSVEELSTLSEQELGMTADSAMNKFKKTVEDLKIALVPVGKAFLEAVTPIVEFAGNILEKFGSLSEGTKKAITLMVTVIGGLGPILLMTFGLLANGVANIIKLFLTLRNGYLRLTGQSQILGESTQYLTMEQIEAAAASHSLNQAHATLTQQFTAEASAVNQLILAYQNATKAAAAFAISNPGAMRLPMKKFADGGIVRGSGGPTGDKIPIMASDGEAVIPARTVNANKKIIGELLSTGTFKPKVDVTGSSGSAARSSFSYSGVNRLLRGEGMPGATVGVPGNMPSQSQSRSLFKSVDVPGAMDVSHFGNKQTRTGQELVKMVEGLETTLANNIRKMVASVDNGATETFRVFDNQVVAQLTEINRLMDKKGKANLNKVKTNIVGDAFAPVRDIELQTQLEAASVPLQDIKVINQKLTDEMKIGFNKLGDATEITSDQLDKLIREAYEAVAKTDERVAKAYSRMKEITTVFEPGKNIDGQSIRGKRIPITTDSYVAKQKTKIRGKNVFRGAQERMSAPGEVPYPEIARFGINEKMIQGLGLNVKEAQAKFKELSDTTKVELSKLQGSAKEFAIAFKGAIDEVEASGVALGQAAVKSIGKGAKTSSPSKDTIKTGEDVGKGLELGMQSRKDDVARVGQSLGETATQSTQSGSRRVATRPQGAPSVPVSQVAGSAPISPDLKQKVVEQARITQNASDKLRSLDRNIMGASFAISSLSGLASMTGGTLGEMSGTISKVTGAMFALQAVTGLLTQTNMISLLQKRAETAGILVGNVATKKMGLNTTLFSGGIKKLLPNLLNFGKVIARFLGPIGLAITAFGATVSIIKMVNAARERERLAIEGLGDAALLSTDKLKTLGDFFGIVPTKSPLEQAKPVTVVSAQERTKVDELRGSEAFQRDFGKDIQALKGATNKQAELVLKAVSVQLKGKGFQQEQIQTIITALKDEAGKTEVKLDFKALDLSTDAGVAAVTSDVNTLLNSYGKAFEKGYSSKVNNAISYATGETVSWTTETISKGLQKNVNTASKSIGGFMIGISGQFANGTINAEKFNQSFDGISNKIKDMPRADALFLMQNVLKNLPSELAQSAAGIKNVSDQLLIAKAAALGVATITPAMVKQLKAAADSGEGAASRAASRVRAKINADMKAIQTLIGSVVESTKDFQDLGDTGGPKDDPFAFLQPLVDNLRNTRNAAIGAFGPLEAIKQLAAGKIKLGGFDKGLTAQITSALGKSKIKPNDDFINAVLGLDQKTFDKVKKTLFTFKNGVITGMTPVGESLAKAYGTAAVKPLDDYIRKQMEATTGSVAQQTAFLKLANLGVDLATAYDMVTNTEDAASINTEKNNDKLKAATTNFTAAKAAAKAYEEQLQQVAERSRLLADTSPEGQAAAFAKGFDDAMQYFDATSALIESQRNGAAVYKAYNKTIEEQTDKLAQAQIVVDGYQKTIDDAQFDLAYNTTYGQKVIDSLNAQIETIQRAIDINFERPLQALSEEGDRLSNTLSLIDRQESKINEKYDAQAAALTKISEINSEIANQQKQQLGLADALSRGDIAAAAAAAQEMRAQAAANAQGRQSGVLESARTAELAGVTVNGMTRAQIEERQFQISQQSFALQQARQLKEAEIAAITEQIYQKELLRKPIMENIARAEENIAIYKRSTLEPAQRLLDTATKEKEQYDKITQNLIDGINYLGQTKEGWIAANVEIEAAKASGEGLEASMLKAKGYTDAIAAKWKELDGKVITTTHNVIENRTVYVTTINVPGAKPTGKMYGGKIMAMSAGGMVPKYMARGGAVGSDTVPAMLTPGEFVMNKGAVKRFGPMLENMNNSKYPSMIKDLTPTTYTNVNSSMVTPIINNVSTSVSDNSSTMYNYNVGINVNESNASSGDIARAVIGQIKYIDSQRIRGQR